MIDEEALVIEDTPRGIAAGKAAGIRVVTIPNSLTANLDISAADFRIKSIMELPDLIEKINHD